MVDHVAEIQRLCRAVDWFAEEMKMKLLAKVAEGWTGWHCKEYIHGGDNMRQVLSHVDRLKNGEPQEVDIANLCMFRARYRYLGPGSEVKDANDTPR